MERPMSDEIITDIQDEDSDTYEEYYSFKNRLYLVIVPVQHDDEDFLRLQTMRINGYHLAAWGIEEIDDVISRASLLSHVSTATLGERSRFFVWGNDAIVVRIK
jgi:hypothetical protein